MFFLCSENKAGTYESSAALNGSSGGSWGWTQGLVGAETMANLKLVEREMETNKQKPLAAALKQIDQAFGKGSVMRLGEKPVVEIEAISTGSLGLDIALGIGGLPTGRIVEI